MPTEFLKKLPGVDSNNINAIKNKVKNMVELCQLEEEELKKIIPPRNAKELKMFLSKKIEIGRNNNDNEDF